MLGQRMMDDADQLQDDPEGPTLFAFRPEEKCVVQEVIDGLRERVAHRSTSPSELRHLSVALLALQRLPLPTSGIELNASLVYRFGGEMSYIGLYIGSSSFRLQTGGSAYDPEVGSDSYSQTIFEVEPSGFRSSDGWCALSGWTESFRVHCRDREWHLSFDWLGDEAEIDWAEEAGGEDLWDRLNVKSEGEDE
jgi:hypothetical protein